MQRSAMPISLIRKVIVTRPSQYQLPPYLTLIPSKDDEAVYDEVIKHTTDSNSKIKGVRVIDIDGRWVTLGELADCVRKMGQVSTSIIELHVRVLQYLEMPDKIIFPWSLSVYLLVGDFKCKSVMHHFRRDQHYILSHQNELLFPALQKLGEGPHDSHW